MFLLMLVIPREIFMPVIPGEIFMPVDPTINNMTCNSSTTP
jgi:hypothetical protein